MWKSHVKKHLAFKAHLDFIEDCEAYHVSSCNLKPLRPALHCTATIGNLSLTHASLFCIRLLVGCDGLEKDAARFQTRNTGRSAGDPTCKIWGNGVEDVEHFISACAGISDE